MKMATSSSTTLVSAVLVGLLMTAGASCPEGCRCISGGVYCTEGNMRPLPKSFPISTESLYLFRYNLSSILKDQFTNLPLLESLNLRGNHISNLAPQAYAGLPILQELILSDNELVVIPRKSLVGLRNLERLLLSNNSIIALNGQAFRDLSSLRVLKLDRNEIVFIFGSAMKGLESLEILDLSSNQLEIVPAECLQSLGQLRELNLQNNKILALNDDGFSGLGKLDRLYLDSNRIGYVSSKAFRNLDSLRELTLKNNLITVVPGQAIGLAKTIEILRLAGNPLNMSDLSSLRAAPTILELDLANIGRLSKRALLPLENLTNLNISNCSLARVPILRHLVTMQVLDLSWNNITTLPPEAFSTMTDLTHLRLSNINLSSIEPNAFAGLSSLQHLSLENNQLKTLPRNLFMPLRSLELLDLYNNPWSCDCRLHWLIRWAQFKNFFFSTVLYMKCSTPANFKRTELSLAEVPIKNLSCIPPRIVSSSKDLYLSEGDPAFFNCDVSGFPIPDVEWLGPGGKPIKHTGDGRRFPSKEGTLEIFNVSRKDAGQYVCWAGNGGGNATRSFNLTVTVSTNPHSSTISNTASTSSGTMRGTTSTAEGATQGFGILGNRVSMAILIGTNAAAFLAGMLLVTLIVLIYLFWCKKKTKKKPVETAVDKPNRSSRPNDYQPDASTQTTRVQEVRPLGQQPEQRPLPEQPSEPKCPERVYEAIPEMDLDSDGSQYHTPLKHPSEYQPSEYQPEVVAIKPYSSKDHRPEQSLSPGATESETSSNRRSNTFPDFQDIHSPQAAATPTPSEGPAKSVSFSTKPESGGMFSDAKPLPDVTADTPTPARGGHPYLKKSTSRPLCVEQSKAPHVGSSSVPNIHSGKQLVAFLDGSTPGTLSSTKDSSHRNNQNNKSAPGIYQPLINQNSDAGPNTNGMVRQASQDHTSGSLTSNPYRPAEQASTRDQLNQTYHPPEPVPNTENDNSEDYSMDNLKEPKYYELEGPDSPYDFEEGGTEGNEKGKEVYLESNPPALEQVGSTVV
ncbi:uncharacterized protein LOC144879965 [Branchiostoma floridae x Branchiostoma japonicum]